jgi:hypothetical protein
MAAKKAHEPEAQRGQAQRQRKKSCQNTREDAVKP